MPPPPRATASQAKPAVSSPPVAASIPKVAPSITIVQQTGPLQWSDFAGPFPKPTVTAGQKVWAAVPVSGSWGAVKLTVLEVSQVDDKFVFAKSQDKELVIPAAFVVATDAPREFAKTSAVAASAEGTRVYGRVVSSSSTTTTVRYRFAGAEVEKELDATLISLLDGTLKFGNPIAYSERREGDPAAAALPPKWHWGVFISTAEGRTWIVDHAGRARRLPVAAIRTIPQLASRVGDRVMVSRQGEFRPATVKNVLGDLLRYEVTMEDGDEFPVSYELLSPPM